VFRILGRLEQALLPVRAPVRAQLAELPGFFGSYLRLKRAFLGETHGYFRVGEWYSPAIDSDGG